MPILDTLQHVVTAVLSATYQSHYFHFNGCSLQEMSSERILMITGHRESTGPQFFWLSFCTKPDRTFVPQTDDSWNCRMWFRSTTIIFFFFFLYIKTVFLILFQFVCNSV